jgi:DNA-binding transcriptional ArsR family regulator
MDTLLRPLADEKRCEIVRLVWSEELPASSIASHFPEVSRSAVSQHLGILRNAGLLRERREGTRRLYRADQAEVARIRAFIDSFWTGGLERLRDLAEASERERP